MPHRFDATLKEIVSNHPNDFAELFGLPKDESAKTLNVDLSTLSAATDVALAFGEPIREIVDLNFQASYDAKLPSRLLVYNSALHARYETPVRSVAVLLRSKADGSSLSGNLAYAVEGTGVEFRYDVVRLWNRSAEDYLLGKPGLLPLATLGRLPAGKPLVESLRDVLHSIATCLRDERDQAEASRLITAGYVLAGLRLPRSSLQAIYQGVRTMQETEELTAYDEAVQIYENALKLGEVRHSRRTLLRLGANRFGAPDSTVENRLSAIDDIDRLDRMTDAVLMVKTWDELLATA